MVVHVKAGDIFVADVDILVNATNPGIAGKAIMGRGIALLFKQRYPKMFQQYQVDCAAYKCELGNFNIYRDIDDVWHRDIMCFHSMTLERGYARLEDIEKGLKNVVKYLENSSESIAFCAIGCGVGGLKFADVKALIIKYLEPLPNYVELYEPK
jgi:O-acetyl-ADP-ribose deacetylase (regulator of RNase III)